MIHYQTYTSVEAEKLVDLWNRSYGADFPMDLRLWQQNVDLCKRTYPDTSIVAWKDGHIIGAVIGKNPNKISTIFVAPEYRRRGIATELLSRVEVAFTGELETTVVAGQDDRHFFPGVPETSVAAQSFLAARGYTKSDGFACDMIRSLADWQDQPIKGATACVLDDLKITLQRCTPDLVASLLEHVEANFSDRWLKDTRDRLSLEVDPSEIVIAVEDGTSVIGFCHTYSIRSAVIGPSIYWRQLLGAHYGGLGPIGVAKHRRKIGLGLALLNYSVSKVAETGATTMVIDWTNLVDFYARAGFEIWKRYHFFSKTY